MSDLLAGAGLFLGVAGGVLETKGLSLLIRSAGGWGGGPSPEMQRKARWWLYPGIAGIILAFSSNSSRN
jgi:hypothetical protein